MKKFIKYLQHQKYELSQIVQNIKIDTTVASLHVKTHGKKYHFSLRKNGTETYITQTQAAPLAQKEYNNKLVRMAKEQIKVIESFLKKYRISPIDEVFDNMHPGKQGFVIQSKYSFKERLKHWRSIPYRTNSINKKYQYKTIRGEMVRSKSEKILADMFFRLGLEYFYEKPLYLEERNPIFPDFTFLDPITKEEIYWEHFGMMSHHEYLNEALNKIKLYEKNGIFQGDRLISTYEFNEDSFDFEHAEFLAREFLC